MGRVLRFVGILVLMLCVFCCVVGVAVGIPNGRVYELVSPVFKGGYGATPIDAVAWNGESVAFGSDGAFGGASSLGLSNEYVARRSVSGWSTVAQAVPATLGVGEPFAFSLGLESSLTYDLPAPNEGASLSTLEEEFFLHRTETADIEENFIRVPMVLRRLDGKTIKGLLPVDTSDDLCHAVLFGGLTEAPLNVTVGPSAGGDVGSLYDLTLGCGGEPSLRLVNVNNNSEVIDPYCPALLGKASGGEDPINRISKDGSEIFFTADANRAEKGKCDTLTGLTAPNNPGVLYVRVGGVKTLEVSVPRGCVEPCSSMSQRRASFEGASESGDRVFFTTAQSLASGDTDEQEDLYMATIGCPGGGESEECESAQKEVTSLVQVSHDPQVGEAAEVQGVVGLAPDGRRVYFVARGVLSESMSAQGERAEKGADNLYMYEDPAGGAPPRTVFVADLCSGPELSGSTEDARCPVDLDEQRSDKGLWSGGGAQVSSGDGGFLVFSSYGQLITFGPQADTDNASDVYRYDAESGALERVSLGEDGYHGNGNGEDNATETADATLSGRGALAVSEDGSRIVFTSAEPLSPDVSNGLVNAYEWHEEQGSSEDSVSLVSSGSDEEEVSDVVITASGRDVFFVTVQGLVAQDTDGAPDVYDARLGGGFPASPSEPEPCSGDGCQGPLTNPAPLLVPGSVSQAPGDDFPPPKAMTRKKAKKKKAKTKKASAKKKAKAKRAARANHRVKVTAGREGRR
jgi:hypothetical protein